MQLRTQDPAILTPAELAVDQSGDEMLVNSCDTFSPQRPNSPNALGAIAGPQHLSVTEVTPKTLPTEPATFTQLRSFSRSTSVVSVAPLADTTTGDGSISLPRQQSPCPSSEASLDLHDLDNSSHIITVNVGPMGLAEALPSLVQIVQLLFFSNNDIFLNDDLTTSDDEFIPCFRATVYFLIIRMSTRRWLLCCTINLRREPAY